MEGKVNVSNTIFEVKKDELKVRMKREYDAPRELVFKAFTDSELIAEWWGPPNARTRIDDNEVRVGGAWRFVIVAPDGRVDAFYGKYLKLKSPEVITHTFNYEPIGPGHEVTETAAFERLKDGRTMLTATCEYKDLQDLEGMVGAGMEAGASQSYDRLAELLEKMKDLRRVRGNESVE